MDSIKESSPPQLLSPIPQGPDRRFTLTWMALMIVLIAIVGVILLLYAKPFDASKDIRDIMGVSPGSDSLSLQKIARDSLLQRKLELIKYVQEEKKDYRDFFLKICQMILLNLLLPILTAILGYKVGTSAKEE